MKSENVILNNGTLHNSFAECRQLHSNSTVKSVLKKLYNLEIGYRIPYAIYRYLRLRISDKNNPIGCSLAPTVKCNLHCIHCYEKKNRELMKEELSVEEIDLLAEMLVKDGIKHCTLTDGEPLLNKVSIAKCERIVNRFWVTYIVTNGTKELLDFPVLYIVSLDGTPNTHDKIRGRGVFETLKRNVNSAPTDNIYFLCTLNTINHNEIPEIVKTAEQLSGRGIMFNWHTPISYDDNLWVDYSARNEDIEKILALKEKYGKFIYNTEYEMNHLRDPKWTAKCPNSIVISIDAFGNVKKPCIFGECVICEKCGCHVFPALLEVVKKGRRSVEWNLILDFVKNVWLNL